MLLVKAWRASSVTAAQITLDLAGVGSQHRCASHQRSKGPPDVHDIPRGGLFRVSNRTTLADPTPTPPTR